MNDHYKEFLQTVRARRDLWRAYDFRVLALKVNGRWRNISAHGYLRSAAAADVPRLTHLPRGPSVRAWQVIDEIGDLTRLRRLLSSISRGELRIGDDNIVFASDGQGDGEAKPYRVSAVQFLTDVSRLSYQHLTWPGYLVTATGDDTEHDYVSRLAGNWPGLEREIRRPGKPYTDLAELSVHVAGVRGWYRAGHNVLVSWFAPLEARLDASTNLRGGQLQFCVRGAERALRKGKLTVIAQPNVVTSAQRLVKHIAFARRQTNADSSGAFVDGVMPFNSHERVTATLSVGPDVVECLTLRDYVTNGGNSRMAIYQVIDPGLGILREGLFPKDHKAKKHFEGAVARLFSLLGFEVDCWSENPRLGDAVDVVVHSPLSATCFALECTTNSLNPDGKIGKFVARLGALSEAAPNVAVRGVLVTCLDSAHLSPDNVENAAKAKLLLLHRESLERLLSMAALSVSIRDLVAFLESCTPRVALSTKSSVGYAHS